MKRKGLSLVELILLITIILVISVAALLSLNPAKTVKLDTAVQKIAVDLNYARSLALATAKWYGVSFEADPANSYTLYQTDGTIEAAVNFNFEFGGVKIQNVDFGGGRKVEFSPLGTPYANRFDPSPISTSGLVSLEYSGLTKSILITPNTGKITIQ